MNLDKYCTSLSGILIVGRQIYLELKGNSKELGNVKSNSNVDPD
jgi:hypothetical protein